MLGAVSASSPARARRPAANARRSRWPVPATAAPAARTALLRTRPAPAARRRPRPPTARSPPRPTAGLPSGPPVRRPARRASPPKPSRRGPEPDSSRDRAQTTRAASSRDKMPATVAAATSPCEWPTTASGWTPGGLPHRSQRHHHRPQQRLDHVGGLERHRRARRPATSPRRGRAPRRTRRAAPRTPASSSAAHDPSPPTAHPARGTRTPPGPAPAAPVTTPARRLARRHRGQARRQLVRAVPDHHRAVLEHRPRPSQRPGHIGGGERRRPRPLAPASLPACPASAAADRPDTTQAWLSRRHHRGCFSPWRRPVPGPPASSRIRWTLVPLMPNEETPARRRWPGRGGPRAPAR